MNKLDPKHIPSLNSDFSDCGCKEPVDPCPEMKEGAFEFEGPALVFPTCTLSKSHLVVKVEQDCDIKWNAIWNNGRLLLDTEGKYKVIYKWDACKEPEPTFGKEAYPCPCK